MVICAIITIVNNHNVDMGYPVFTNQLHIFHPLCNPLFVENTTHQYPTNRVVLVARVFCISIILHIWPNFGLF